MPKSAFRKRFILILRMTSALALALLAEHRGDSRAAAGFRRRAERTIAMTRKRTN